MARGKPEVVAPAQAATSPAQPNQRINVDEPAGSAAPVNVAPQPVEQPKPERPAYEGSYGISDLDRDALLTQVIEADLRFDPKAAYDKLRASEHIGTTVVLTQHALAEALALAALASKLAFYARRQAKRWSEVGAAEALAKLREEARCAIGERVTAKGEPKAIPMTELDEWIVLTRGPKRAELVQKGIDFDAWSAHAERYASLFQWRAADIRRMSEAAQAQGDFGPS